MRVQYNILGGGYYSEFYADSRGVNIIGRDWLHCIRQRTINSSHMSEN